MEIKNIDDEFDGDKILETYAMMTRDDVIDLLGNEYAPILKERINQGTINFDEFTEICYKAFPNYQGRARWIRNLIFNKLSKVEGFYMFESDIEKRKMYAKMTDLEDKAKNGTLSALELKYLCDLVFGENSQYSKLVYEKMIETGRVKLTENDAKSSNPAIKSVIR